ncbi:MAG: MotA/TolQ/ExbB proton channel family protein [Proteobacteria bacterium]|nr:MotA/TolQ/ExbB proton channel family protein [Pseudomonadota bacterium]
MFSLFQSGGSFMYVILCVSIIALALFAERATFLYFKMKMNIEGPFQKIVNALEKMNYRGAIEECTRIESHPMGRILKAGLLKADKRDKDIERVLEEKILQEIPLVKARINLLTMFANISTLLGLLGTIIGLISAFQGVSSANAAMKQEILANGISVAMLTTAFGLIVAIPCLAGYYILNNRGEYLIDQFEEKALSLFNTLSSIKRDKEASC